MPVVYTSKTQRLVLHRLGSKAHTICILPAVFPATANTVSACFVPTNGVGFDGVSKS